MPTPDWPSPSIAWLESNSNGPMRNVYENGNMLHLLHANIVNIVNSNYSMRFLSHTEYWSNILSIFSFKLTSGKKSNSKVKIHKKIYEITMILMHLFNQSELKSHTSDVDMLIKPCMYVSTYNRKNELFPFHSFIMKREI